MHGQNSTYRIDTQAAAPDNIWQHVTQVWGGVSRCKDREDKDDETELGCCLQLPQMYVSSCSAYSLVRPTHTMWNQPWQRSHCTQLIWSATGWRHWGAEHIPSSSSSSRISSLHPSPSFELPLPVLCSLGFRWALFGVEAFDLGVVTLLFFFRFFFGGSFAVVATGVGGVGGVVIAAGVGLWLVAAGVGVGESSFLFRLRLFSSSSGSAWCWGRERE